MNDVERRISSYSSDIREYGTLKVTKKSTKTFFELSNVDDPEIQVHILDFTWEIIENIVFQ